MNSVNIPVTPGTRTRLTSFSGSEVDDASIIIGIQEAAGCCGIPPATFVQQYSNFCTDHHAADCDRCDPNFLPESAACSFSRSSGGVPVTSHFSSPLGIDACSQPDWLYGAEAYPSSEASQSLPTSWSYNVQHPCQEAFSLNETREQKQRHTSSCAAVASSLPSWAANHSNSSLASFASHSNSSDSSSQASFGAGGSLLNSRFFAEWMQGRGSAGTALRDSQTGVQRCSNDGSCTGRGSASGKPDDVSATLSGVQQ